MEDAIMSDKWMSIAAAAATLNVHPRTIERRIASGRIQSRRGEDGQVQVLINAPDAPPDSANFPPPPNTVPNEALETVKELAQDQVSLATGSASALVRFAQDDALRARQELSVVRQDVARARRDVRFAWSAVALMAGAIIVAVGWTTQKLTRADADVRLIDSRAAAMEIENQRLARERDDARIDAEHAKLAQAQATGRLAGYIDQTLAPGKRPTTRPTNVFQRLADAISGG
jgi:hypothetical protein